jgi:hypothetical protein
MARTAYQAFLELKNQGRSSEKSTDLFVASNQIAH